MSDLTPVPATKFDASRHVIAGRDAKTGVQRFFTLKEIAEAEHQIEVTPDAPAPEVTKADLQALEQRVAAALASVPPAQFPADLMETLTTLTQTLVSLAQRIEKLEADNQVFTENFVQFKALTGAGA